MAVPRAKAGGRIKPYGPASTTGIKVTKNRTNIVGQNASEKLSPNIKEANELSCLYSFESFNKLNDPFNLIIPNINKPTKFNKGPIIFRSQGKYKGRSCSNPLPSIHTKTPNNEKATTFPSVKYVTSLQAIFLCIERLP